MRITLKNFRCHTDHTFDFGESGMALMTGSSGVGKSSIMAAIQFALFGTGAKLVAYGKTSCSVEMHFDGMKIVRSKRPNRLMVNDTYSDDAAQSVITGKFGDTFDVTGYIAQNALNSFVLMSPVDKLAFLERFAFRDVDLAQIKGRCKALIGTLNDELVTTTSQLAMATEWLERAVVPEKVVFPVKCKKSQRALAGKNVAVKKKNCETLLRRSGLQLNHLHDEVNALRVLQATIDAKLEAQDDISEKIDSLSLEQTSVDYIGDTELTRMKHELSRVEDHQEATSLARDVENIRNSLRDMEDDEKQTLSYKINELETDLWHDQSAEDCASTITYLRGAITDGQKIKTFRDELKKCASNVSLTEKETELAQLKIDLDEKQRLKHSFDTQKDVYNCPSCSTNLRVIDGGLHVASGVEKLSGDPVTIERELREADRAVRSLSNIIFSETQKADRRKDLENRLCDIEKKYDDQPILEDDTEDLDDLLNYVTAQESAEKRLNVLKRLLRDGGYSETCVNFRKNFERKETKLADLRATEYSETDFSLSETDLRNTIATQNQAKNDLSRLQTQSTSLQNEWTRHDKALLTARNNHENAFGSKRIEADLLIETSKLETQIAYLETEASTHNTTLTKIEEWSRYDLALTAYIDLQNQVATHDKAEKISRQRYASASLLREKIVEAESIAMSNIAASIDIHTQLYLDYFFPDNPLSAKLQLFKTSKTKQTVKPQLNIEIDYKGMEMDLTTLSGGELSRVILAYTLALGEMFNIPLLLLDECTASLDQEMTETVFEGIRDNFNGKLAIIVAHQTVSGSFDKVVSLE
jgi:DNA repair exonuclease SbcCD ATPase subunit